MDRGAHTGMSFAADVIANYAKGKAPHRTGALKNSIQPGEPTGSLSNGDLQVNVAAAATYAPYVEHGTGIYGPHGTPIVPVTAQALQIPLGGGEYMYRRSVKGMKAQPFMQPAVDEAADDAADALARAIDLSLAEYGRAADAD